MVFSSLFFVFVFLAIVLAVYYILKPLPIIYRNVWLFLSSIFFYAWGEPKFCIVMLVSITFNYLWGLLVEKFRNAKAIKPILFLAIFSNLALLFVVKYLTFTMSVFNSIFGELLRVPKILLPIGVSFYTFQSISYILDVYHQKGKAQKNPLNVGLYIAFFPQLIAGPIVRYDTVANQILKRKESISDFAQGVERFLIGFSKKVLLANTFAEIADLTFNSAWKGFDLGVDFAWIGAIAYSFQIFYDFSGYSDMAIGLGKMFGFQFEENFRYPYAASSVSDFWRRWHISLGSWFRDYVYIPLGGSRVKMPRLIFNTFVVWMLTGIWHGANWTFLLWGFMYFLLIDFEKMTKLPEKLKSSFPRMLYRIFTLLCVQFGWIIFRCETPGTILRYVKAMFGLAGNSLHDARSTLFISENIVFWVAGILLAIPFFDYINKWVKRKKMTERIWGIGKPICLILLFLISLSFLVVNEYNPFIYFNF